MVVGLAGLLFVTSGTNARGTDLRPGRYVDLPELVQDRSQRVEALQARSAQLQAEIDALSSDVSNQRLRRLGSAIDVLQPAAGLTAVRGPGLAVALDDAPRDQELPALTDADLLVVHQQDIQAVVNALWAGGAEAMMLQSQRIVATTGIKCVGNTVLLHGVPYSPPYRIVAVGNPDQLRAGLDSSEYIDNYLDYTAPPYNLGWAVKTLTAADIPAYEGPLDLSFAASPVTGSEPQAP